MVHPVRTGCFLSFSNFCYMLLGKGFLCVFFFSGGGDCFCILYSFFFVVLISAYLVFHAIDGKLIGVMSTLHLYSSRWEAWAMRSLLVGVLAMGSTTN